MSGFTSLWRHDIEKLSTLAGFVLAIILNNLLNKSSVIDDFIGHCACATWVDFSFTKIHNRGNVDMVTLRWRHNDRDGVSNHQRLDCLLNRLCRRRSKKASKLRVTGLCAGNSPVTGDPHKGPVTWKMFPFDDFIMQLFLANQNGYYWLYLLYFHFLTYFRSKSTTYHVQTTISVPAIIIKIRIEL